MATSPTFALREPFRKIWSEPLSLRESATVAFTLFIGGTIYCQIYCFIAFQGAMQGMTMPLSLSMQRSIIETLPAFVSFEFSKRVLLRGVGARSIGLTTLVVLFGAALSVVIALRCAGLFAGSAMPIRLAIADRLPSLTITTLAIAWACRQACSANATAGQARERFEALPPTEWIDWARAAGNYVEFRVHGRSVLKRMTMTQAEEALSAKDFVRVHRSLLVNRDRVKAVDNPDRPSRVELIDGTMLKVGEKYRVNLSTNDWSLRHI